jgi:hypothetical protein
MSAYDPKRTSALSKISEAGRVPFRHRRPVKKC